jgi:hypothetical protein
VLVLDFDLETDVGRDPAGRDLAGVDQAALLEDYFILNLSFQVAGREIVNGRAPLIEVTRGLLAAALLCEESGHSAYALRGFRLGFAFDRVRERVNISALQEDHWAFPPTGERKGLLGLPGDDLISAQWASVGSVECRELWTAVPAFVRRVAGSLCVARPELDRNPFLSSLVAAAEEFRQQHAPQRAVELEFDATAESLDGLVPTRLLEKVSKGLSETVWGYGGLSDILDTPAVVKVVATADQELAAPPRVLRDGRSVEVVVDEADIVMRSEAELEVWLWALGEQSLLLVLNTLGLQSHPYVRRLRARR